MQQLSQTELEQFTAFINDASRFVRYFAMAMAKSAPHIYLSTLPFAPTCSLVSMHYSNMFPQTLHVKSGQLTHWPSSEMVISHVGSSVHSIALSPDGQHIVSGLRNGTVCVWNAMTGEMVAGPFHGHSKLVNSVAFSPDGQHIASGSNDQTIHVWNAMTGETVAGPYTGHSGSVTSVAFSPDGQHIASGSDDQTIRVWKIMTGETKITGQVDFTNHSKINDEGWICGSNNELLMWIPPLHRSGLHRPSNIWISSEHETCLDLSTFVHGHNWSTCIKN